MKAALLRFAPPSQVALCASWQLDAHCPLAASRGAACVDFALLMTSVPRGGQSANAPGHEIDHLQPELLNRHRGPALVIVLPPLDP